MAAGVGVDLDPVETPGAEAARLVFPGDLQHLHEHRLEFFGEAPPEGRQGVVIGVAIAGDVEKRQGIVGGALNLAAGAAADGIAVDQQRQERRRAVGRTAPPALGPLQLA